VTNAPLKKRFMALAILVGMLLGVPVTELILRTAYNHTGIRNGPWSMHPDAGSADSSPLVRAAIARYAVGSNTIDEAIYWHAARTSRDAALHSSRNYVVHFSGEPDVSEFWSLTLYDEEDKLSRNPAEHYSLSNGIPLRRNAEGSFDIVVSRDAPSGEANWLSAPPSGNFSLLLRYYGASRAVLDAPETTTLPTITQLDGAP
jgi:hypothetical protein